jgi:threonylcarbamoyladenosine tRNA methylthiotransferase MtaB
MVDVVTFGCRLNACESETIRDAADRADLPETVVFNTCAVTNEAVAQARQSIRRVARERPEARIVVTGCAAQVQGEMFARMPEVARVVGNADKMRHEAWLAAGAALAGAAPQADEAKLAISDVMIDRAMASYSIRKGRSGLPRAFVQVQNGCDHRCTFCIIPYGRGNSRSAPLADVIAQVRAAIEAGQAEIVLTGVDLTSYGADLPGAPKLGRLVKEILRQAPELKRLRLSSIDSIEADRDLFDVIASDERLMPHLHLSLQSGDDLILKRMKRRHARSDAIAFCDQVRKLRPDVVFGADIIAGFPTETEEMFARSLDLVTECDLALLHVFPFSPRPSTPAARMPQVRADVIRARAARLREAGATVLRRRLGREIGMTRAVLIESERQGRTEHFLPVAISSGRPGEVRQLVIADEDGTRLAV